MRETQGTGGSVWLNDLRRKKNKNLLSNKFEEYWVHWMREWTLIPHPVPKPTIFSLMLLCLIHIGGFMVISRGQRCQFASYSKPRTRWSFLIPNTDFAKMLCRINCVCMLIAISLLLVSKWWIAVTEKFKLTQTSARRALAMVGSYVKQ